MTPPSKLFKCLISLFLHAHSHSSHPPLLVPNYDWTIIVPGRVLSEWSIDAVSVGQQKEILKNGVSLWDLSQVCTAWVWLLPLKMQFLTVLAKSVLLGVPAEDISAQSFWVLYPELLSLSVRVQLLFLAYIVCFLLWPYVHSSDSAPSHLPASDKCDVTPSEDH